ncbi:MAG: CDP-alcohol phosphatidyltransferase family protein [Mucilaginibacter sp.]
MSRTRKFYIINGITFYRMLVAPVLVYLIVAHRFDIFKWLLLLSFFTDAIDGYLARMYKITSAFGSRIDSIADDLTIIAAIVGIYVWHPTFILYEIVPVSILLILYLVQNTLALIRYKRLTSFHTYSAKIAAILQGIFMIAYFFLPYPIYWLFYLVVIFTVFDLVEEIVLILSLRIYRTNVRGLYWLKKEKHD